MDDSDVSWCMNNFTLEDAFYDVSATPLIFPDSDINTGVLGMRRTDTGQLVGTSSHRYGITQNVDLVESAELAFANSGLDDYDTLVHIHGHGSRVFITYDFTGDVATREISKGDVVGLRLTLVNSFDCSHKRSIRLGMHRQVSMSGMSGMNRSFALDQRHTIGNIEINQPLVNSQVESAKELIDLVVDRYQDFSLIGLSQDRGEMVIDYMVDREIIGLRLGEGIKDIWRTPTYSQDSPRNLYSFSNACFQYLDSPHSEYGRRFYEASNKAKEAIFTFCDKIANKPDMLDTLFDNS